MSAAAAPDSLQPYSLDIAPKGVATQSSYSRWSAAGEAQGAVGGKATGKCSFHTDLEHAPWWMIDLQSTVYFDDIVIDNRLDDCAERANRLAIHTSTNGFDWLALYHHDGTPFGGSDGKPLVIACPRTAARFVRISIDDTTALHLDKIRILDRHPDLQECLAILQDRRFTTSLNNSGIGDQVMAARVATWIGEKLGMRFLGLTDDSPGIRGSRSSVSGNANPREMLQTLGLAKLIEPNTKDAVLVRLPYAASLSELIIFLANQALAYPERLLSLHLDGAEADFYIKSLDLKNESDVFSSSFDFRWGIAAGRTLLSQRQVNPDENILLLHLRLGDIANIYMPDGKIIIPNHLVHLGPELGLISQGSGTNFERYDKRREIYNLIARLRSSGQRIRLHSDGFAFTYAVVNGFAARISPYYSIDNLLVEIRRMEEELADATSGIVSVIGEGNASLGQLIGDVDKATHVISTTGHFAFNLVTSLSKGRKKRLLTERLDRTMLKNKDVDTSFWTDNFSRDIDLFVQTWEGATPAILEPA